MTAKKLGKYELLQLIGQGGMARVFRSRSDDGRDYALKILMPELSSLPDQRERFLREARNCALLDHPNVLRVFEVSEGVAIGEFKEQPFMAMELVEGCSLQEKMEQGVEYIEALTTAASVADGLAWAHSEGIIHRDLKPANVMIASSGQVKVADWGLSKALEDEGQLTKEGTLLGTPKYMAPELLKGRPASVRSDLYAFGIMLYQMISGRPPIMGRTVAEILDNQLKKKPVKLKMVAPHVPMALSELVTALLEKDPRNRPASADELAVTLRALSNSGLPENGMVTEQPATSASKRNLPIKKVKKGKSTKPSTAPLKVTEQMETSASRKSYIPILAIGLLVLAALIGLFHLTKSKQQPFKLLQPRFQSFTSLLIPFAGKAPPRVFIKVGDSGEVGPLETTQRISPKVRAFVLELKDELPVAARLNVMVRHSEGPDQTLFAKTPELPSSIREKLTALGKVKSVQMSTIYKNLKNEMKGIKANVSTRPKVASLMLEAPIEVVVGRDVVSTLSPWVKRCLHDQIYPGDEMAKMFEPLRYVEAWLTFERDMPKLPWPLITEELGFRYIKARETIVPKELRLFSKRIAVTQYPLRATTGGMANKVWFATKDFVDEMTTGTIGFFASSVNKKALGKGRPELSEYKETAAFELLTAKDCLHVWPLKSARLAIVMTTFIREFQLTVQLNGKQEINIMNGQGSYLDERQNVAFKASMQVSFPIDVGKLNRLKNSVSLRARSIPGCRAIESVGIRAIAIFVEPKS